MRNGFYREKKFGTDGIKFGVQIATKRPWDPHGRLRALCWKTYKQTSIAKPMQNCSTASYGFAVKVRPAIEELHKARKCQFNVPAKLQMCENCFGPDAEIRVFSGSETSEK